MSILAMTVDRLDIRLAVSGLVLLVLAFLVIAALLISGSRQAALETVQRKNLSLAGDIVSMQTRELIDIEGRADITLMRELAEAVMKINPALEVYLLDASGQVLAHALERASPIHAVVDVDAIRPLAIPSIAPPRLPAFASDPARPERLAVFSVAALGHGTSPDGYLYLVLDGQALTPGLASDTLELMLLGTGSIGLGLAISFVWVLSRLTRPLRQLAQTLKAGGGRTEPGKRISGASKEVRLLENEIDSMRRRIKAQLEALRAEDRNRRELIGNVSHDLRTPLAIARGHIETCLIDHAASGKAITPGPLEQTLKQLRRLEKRIRNLFDLARLDHDNIPLTLESFALAELVQDVLDGYRLGARARHVTIAFSPGAQPMPSIRADIALIERLVQNLLDNAFAHTGQNGRVAVEIHKNTHAGTVQIRVSNTGNPIASEDLPHVFERHWKSPDSAGPTSNESAGLGLAIVRRIVELHGGQVGVFTQLHSGSESETVFWTALPLTAGDDCHKRNPVGDLATECNRRSATSTSVD